MLIIIEIVMFLDGVELTQVSLGNDAYRRFSFIFLADLLSEGGKHNYFQCCKGIVFLIIVERW